MNKTEETEIKYLREIMNDAFRNGVKLKCGAEVGKRAVEYFKGDDFFNYINTNKENIKKKYHILFEKRNLNTDKDIEHLIQLYLDHKLVLKAQYKPIKGLTEKDQSGSYKIPKWPKRLIQASTQFYEKNSFYMLVYERNEKLQYIMLGALILVVLICCMFPVWPLKLKLSLWYISVILMTLISFIIVIRLLAFLFFWFVGVDYWIFPNLFDENSNVIESFFPFHLWNYRNDSWFLLFARIFAAVLLTIGIHELGKTHSVADIKHFAKHTFIDILEWGHHKLAATDHNNISMYKSIDTKATFDSTNEDEEEIVYDDNEENYDCLKKCGFETFEELVRKCFLKCSCMEKIIKSDCYLKRCSKVTKDILQEAHKEACFDKSEL